MNFKIFNTFLFLFWVSAYSAFGQYHTDLDIVNLPSAEAGSVSQSGDVPVNLSTGNANITVPVYTLKDGSVELPIYLSYDSRGVKPNEHPGWVGMNWSLRAGGLISRTVKGLPDEYTLSTKKYTPLNDDPYDCDIEVCEKEYDLGRTYYLDELNDESWNSLDNINFHLFEERATLLKNKSFRCNEQEVGQINQLGGGFITCSLDDSNNRKAIMLPDMEPDIFSFNFNGQAGTFLMDKDGNFKVIGNPGIKVQMIGEIRTENLFPHKIPTQSTDVTLTEGTTFFQGFRITTPDGVVYTFGTTAQNSQMGIEASTNAMTKKISEKTRVAWHLTKIEYPTGELVNLLYQRKGRTSNFALEYSLELTNQWQHMTGDYHPNERRYLGHTHQPWYLSSIETANYFIDFATSESTQLTYNLEKISEQRNEQIEVFNIPLQTSSSGYDFEWYADGVPIELLEEFVEPQSGLNPLPDHLISSGGPFSDPIMPEPFPLAWHQLDNILIKNKHSQSVIKEFNFQYSSDATKRLTLNSFGEVGLPSYEFTYNPQELPSEYLPDEGLVDHWGFYNGVDHNQYLTAVSMGNANPSFYFNYRQPSENHVFAEILTEIENPTGGITRFQYEPAYIDKLVDRAPEGFFFDIDIEDIPLPSEILFAGIRIKSITQIPLTTPSVKREFQYENGILSSKPKYFYPLYEGILENGNAYTSTRFLMNGIGGTGGMVSYSKVTEKIIGNGYTENYFTNYNDYLDLNLINSNEPIITQSAPYYSRSYLRHRLVKRKIFNENDNLLKKEEFTYEEIGSPEPIRAVRLARRRVDQGNKEVFEGASYEIPNVIYKMTKQETYDYGEDGTGEIYTYTDYTYESTYGFLKERTFHPPSGSLPRKSITYYPFDYNWTPVGNQTVLDKMETDNMIGIPLRTENYVGTRQVSGSWTKYGLFNSTDVLPFEIYNYEEGWDLELTMDSYTDLGYPTSVTKKGWSPETYEWNQGLLTDKHFNDWHWQWDYNFAENRMLKSSTDIDGQTIGYSYDDNERLIESRARCEGEIVTNPDNCGVVTNYTYQLGNGNNHIYTETKYEDFDTQRNYQYFDGLGRPTRTVQEGYGPNGEDIVFDKIDYDGVGRIHQKLFGIDPVGGERYTRYEYENSPLNRVKGFSNPGFNGGTYKYEIQGDTYVNTVNDANGNPTISYTDVFGRTGTVEDAMGGFTRYEYNNKDLLIGVINAENEFYEYKYDNHNRLIYKKVPGAEHHTYAYNERDLMQQMVDGNMRENGQILVTLYDEYGRVLRTGFGGGSTIDEELTSNTYDETTLGCDDMIEVPQGKLTQSTAKILNPDFGGNTTKQFCYDKFGRNAKTTSLALSFYDEYDYTYDLADNLKNTHREFGGGSIKVNQQNVYDHSGRLKYVFHGINNETPIQLINNTFNPRDELVAKSLHGIGQTTPAPNVLQSIGYQYNEMGWLTHINSMPFPGTVALPTCEDPGIPGDPGCAGCGNDEVSLAQLLTIRPNTENELKVNCYVACDCDDRCPKSDPKPCQAGEEVEPVRNVANTNISKLGASKSIYLIRLCDNSKEYVFEEFLPKRGFTILQTIPIIDLDKAIYVDVKGVNQMVTVQQFIELLQRKRDVTVTDDFGETCKECSKDAPQCSEKDIYLQDKSLSQIEVNLITDAAKLEYPTALYRVRLCDGREIYLLERELANLQGNYLILADILIDGQYTELPIFNTRGKSTGYTLFKGFLKSRRLSDGRNIAYIPCELNLSIKEREITPRDIYYSGFWTDYYSELYNFNVPTSDLISLNTNEENSFLHDNTFWELNEITRDGSREWGGETEWDLGTDIPNDAQVFDYEVSVGIEYPSGNCGTLQVSIALVDGFGNFIEVNGGEQLITDYYDVTNVTGYTIIKLKPDDIPTVQEIQQMRVVFYSSRFHCPLKIDFVKAKLKYTEPLDRCKQEPLRCNSEETEAQQDSLALILADAKYIRVQDLYFPTSLYRVQICDGREIHLLQHELDRLPQPYLILQTVSVNTREDTFRTETDSKETGTTDPLFALWLKYYANDNNVLSSGVGYKNGNIAAMHWQVSGRDRQVYAFNYDKLDRLKTANYAQISYENEYSFDVDYSVPFIIYDKIGNIKRLNRQGPTDFCENNGEFVFEYGTIDLLTYAYGAESRLQSVLDGATERGFDATDSPTGNQAEYEYDANGNIIKDTGKGIGNIRYNYLNLPELITFTDGNEIEFVYDAAGMKLQKIVRESGVELTTIYDEGIEFSIAGTFVYHPEGRASIQNDGQEETIQYEYTLKDHLGNARVTFSDLNGDGSIQTDMNGGYTEVLQENHYYPFGMNMEGSWLPITGSENAYQYNGKELHKDLGLNLQMYGARYYDPAICRFTGVDPIADQFAFVSAYNYAENEPIGHIDLHGLQKASPPPVGAIIGGNIRAGYEYLTYAAWRNTQIVFNGADPRDIPYRTYGVVDGGNGEYHVAYEEHAEEPGFFRRTLDTGLAGLDVAGLFPGKGEVSTMAAKVPGWWPFARELARKDELLSGGGQCESCAEIIQENIGGEIIRIYDKTGAPRIGRVRMQDGTEVTKTDFYHHFAVKKDGLMFDGLTGPEGLPLEQYKQLFDEYQFLNFD